MKKIYSIMAAAAIAFPAFADDAYSVDGISYLLNSDDNTAAVTGCESYITELNIPSSIAASNTTFVVTSIQANAFQLNDNITSAIIPGSVTAIGMNAFADCTSLITVGFAEGLETIGTNAFNFCTSLKELAFPSTLKSIGGTAFESCSAVEKITSLAVTPPAAGFWAFDEISTSIPVYVPVGSIDAYSKADEWGDFTNYQEIEIGGGETSGDIEGNMTWQEDVNSGYEDEPDLGTPRSVEVTASYDPATKALKIYNFAELEPVTFTVDPANSTVTASGLQLAYHEEFEGETFDYYYGDVATKQPGMYGTIYKINDTQCELNIEPWGEALDYADYDPSLAGTYFFNSANYNTVVTLDLTIEGLAGKPEVKIEDVAFSISENPNIKAEVTYSTSNLPEGTVVTLVIVQYPVNGDPEEDGITFGPQTVTESPVAIAISNATDMYYNYKVTLLAVNDGKTIASDVYNAENVIVSGIEDTFGDNATSVRYFNMQGQEIFNPDNGVFIRVEGTKATKVMK